VKLRYSIHLHIKDIDILYQIQRFFGCGNISIREKSVNYEVVKLSDLTSIIEHFDSYPLKTKKYADFLLFKKAIAIVSNKEHLTMIGLTKLINIRATLNKGLPERLNDVFTNIIPVPRPAIPIIDLDNTTPGVKH
jgi:hypothetical protein